jgi:hypothetical protein
VAEKLRLPTQIHFERKLYDVPETFVAVDYSDCIAFLDYLRVCGVPSMAARKLGRGEVAFQVERSKNPEFADAWEWALRESHGVLHAEAYRRAVEGIDKPIFYKDEEIATVKEYSDTLLALLLKSLHPEFKGESGDPAGGNTGAVTNIVINTIPQGKFIDIEDIDPEGTL